MTTKVLLTTGRHIDTECKGCRPVFVCFGAAGSNSEPQTAHLANAEKKAIAEQSVPNSKHLPQPPTQCNQVYS